MKTIPHKGETPFITTELASRLLIQVKKQLLKFLRRPLSLEKRDNMPQAKEQHRPSVTAHNTHVRYLVKHCTLLKFCGYEK